MNNSPSVSIVRVCVYVCCRTVKSCLLYCVGEILLQFILHLRCQLSFVAQSWNVSACQTTRSHDMDPVNLQKDSDWEIFKKKKKKFFLMMSHWWHQWGNTAKTQMTAVISGPSQGFTTTSQVFHALCHMSSLALFPIVPIALHHIDTLHVPKIYSTPSASCITVVIPFMQYY